MKIPLGLTSKPTAKDRALSRNASEARAARRVSRSAQAGLLVGAAAAAKSFERTLMPRSTRDQGAVTGFSVSLAFATAAMCQDLIENAAEFVVRRGAPLSDDDLRRATMMADLAAIGTGAALERQLAQQENESLGRAAARSTGYFIKLAGIAGFTVGFLQDLLDVLDPSAERRGSQRNVGVAVLGGGVMALIAEYRRRRLERRVDEEELLSFNRQEWDLEQWRALITGGGITASLAALAVLERAMGVVTGKALERGLAGNARLWRMAGHAGAIGALGALGYAGLDRVYQRVESGTGKIEPAFDKPPESTYVSGSAESLVSWRSLGREGRRHVLTVLSRDTIETVMEAPAKADPVRVYVGLDSRRTELERVDLAMQELHRTQAFDRELLIAVSPTGTGYVNYAAIECCEYFTLGNCATVTLQYSKRPSPLSLDRVWEGRKQFRMLLAALRRELYKRDPSRRPRLVVFGESLGAHTSQDAFLHEGTQGLDDAGVDRALWIGSPHLSKWKAQVLGPPRPDVDQTVVIDVDSFEEIERLSPEQRERLRYVMITHHNDGVGLFGADLVIQKPPWLGEPELRPPAIPKWMRWTPIITAIHTIIDMKNSMNVVAGEFVANGHDYRADLAHFIEEVYQLQCSDAQLERVESAIRKYELIREQLAQAGSTREENELAEQPRATRLTA